MSTTEAVREYLMHRYTDLERVEPSTFRCVDRHNGKPYAVRYYNTDGRLPGSVEELHAYQERLFGGTYFDTNVPIDLRWNHYLTFVVDESFLERSERRALKNAIERDREYAKKVVISASDLLSSTQPRPEVGHGDVTFDATADILTGLRDSSIDFVLDEESPVAQVVRDISDGRHHSYSQSRPPLPDPAIEAASGRTLAAVTLHNFRHFRPETRQQLAPVTLVTGENGAGKTSFLEAIEYLYCGETRRCDPPEKASVEGHFEGSQIRFATHSGTASASLRARNLAWYGVLDARRSTLTNSFEKFSFLSTDAAVHASVQTSSDRLGGDLTRIVLGQNFGRVTLRLMRVETALDKQHSDIEASLRSLAEKAEMQRRIAEIATETSLHNRESELLREQLRITLDRIGWRGPDPRDADPSRVREYLVRALALVREIQVARDAAALQVSDSTIARTESLIEARGELRDLLARRAEEERSLRLAQGETARLNSQLRSLRRLMAYRDSGYSDLTRRLSRLEDGRSKLPLARLDLGATEFAEFLPSLLDMPVFDSLTALRDERLRCVDAHEAAQQRVRVEERRTAELAGWRVQLREAASRIVELGGAPDVCPLCGTDLPTGDLERHLASPDADAADLGEARATELGLRARLSAIDGSIRSVTQLLQAGLANGGTQPLSHALQSYEERRALRERIDAEWEDARRDRHMLEASGFSTDELEKLEIAIGLSRDADADALGAKSDELELRIAGILKGVTEADRRAAQLDVATATLIRSRRLPHAENSEAILTETDRILELLGRANEAYGTLSQLLPTDFGAVEIIRDALDQSMKLAAQVDSVSRRETAIQERLTSSGTEAAAIDAQRRDAEDRLTRVRRALEVIRTIRSRNSEADVVRKIIASNAQRISDIFHEIHTPNEFSLEWRDSAMTIRRRDSGRSVDLNEMSTGQRAAFVISLFLAMNARLSTAPGIVLMDDPIAHVDDLNTLAMLDHFRTISLQQSRQLIFATSDTRLAGLFRHKFRCLDEGFKEIRIDRYLIA